LVLSHRRFRFTISVPSRRMVPDAGRYHRSRRPTIVLFPEPLAPCGIIKSVEASPSLGRSLTYHKSRHFPGRDRQAEILQHTNGRPSRIAECHALQLDISGRNQRFLPRRIEWINV